MARCVQCGKEEDVEWVHSGHFVGLDGDYVCSDACGTRYKQRLEWIGRVACSSESACLSYLNGGINNPYDP